MTPDFIPDGRKPIRDDVAIQTEAALRSRPSLAGLDDIPITLRRVTGM